MSGKRGVVTEHTDFQGLHKNRVIVGINQIVIHTKVNADFYFTGIDQYSGQGHSVFGQGAGLIGADDICGAQSFHRGQTVDQGVTFGHPHHPARQGDCRHYRQPLGDSGHRQGYGGFDH